MELLGIAHPWQLDVLSRALEEYCRTANIQRGTVEYESAAGLIMELFKRGAATVDELASALSLSPSPRKAAP